jgi:glycosyl-4,4'-diaponeurosporenoate acyltransferase
MKALLIILGNSLFWIAAHVLSGFLVHHVPERIYRVEVFPFRLWSWERNGSFYRRDLKINAWKDKLPEAGMFLSSHPFSKKHLAGYDLEYFQRFILEPCRAELAHITPFFLYPLCLLWNPPVAALVMLLYALLANVPFIFIQRYNRARFCKLACRTTDRQG